MSISYMVENDTDRMEAVHYHEESTIPALRNTFVKIIGVLKSGREQNMVTVYRLSTIQDMNEVMAHQLELVVTPPYQEAAADGCKCGPCQPHGDDPGVQDWTCRGWSTPATPWTWPAAP